MFELTPKPTTFPSTLLGTSLSLSPFDIAQGDLELVERSKGRKRVPTIGTGRVGGVGALDA